MDFDVGNGAVHPRYHPHASHPFRFPLPCHEAQVPCGTTANDHFVTHPPPSRAPPSISFHPPNIITNTTRFQLQNQLQHPFHCHYFAKVRTAWLCLGFHRIFLPYRKSDRQTSQNKNPANLPNATSHILFSSTSGVITTPGRKSCTAAKRKGKKTNPHGTLEQQHRSRSEAPLHHTGMHARLPDRQPQRHKRGHLV